MKVWFVMPEAKKRVGGLETALTGWQDALETAGFSVPVNPALNGIPDVIHLHGLWELSYSRYARYAKKHGIPLVVSPHGMLEPWALRSKAWKKIPFFHLVEKARFRQAKAILATCHLEKKNLQKLLPGCSVVTLPLGGKPPPPLGNRDAIRQRLGLGEDEKTLLYLSRIDRKKGLDLLLQALARLPEETFRHKTRLLIVGEGDPVFTEELHRYVAARGRALPRVQFIGPMWGKEKYDYFYAADLFCLPTHSENFGLAVLEALQCGTPVLTTDQTPWADMAGQAGLHITAPRVETISAALAAWHQQPAWTAEDRLALAQKIQAEFSWDHLAGCYAEFYRRLIEPKV